ncbi:MAG: Flp family type IVb pilin [Gemmata sp.]
MRKFTFLRRLLREESGTTAIEYAVLVAFVVLVCIAGVAAFQNPAGSAISSSTTTIGTYPDP